MAALLEYLLRSPCWKLHAFFRALCKADKGHILSEILHIDPEPYEVDQEDQDERANRKQLKKGKLYALIIF